MTDLAGFREAFPALGRVVYLNTATAPPGAAPVLDALRRAEREWETGEFSWQAWEGDAESSRAAFARLLGVEAASVALMSSVAEAAATVAGSLSSGRVVVGSREFQSNLLPWLALERRGLDVRMVPAEDSVVRTGALVDAIGEGTSLVAVSEVQSSNGFRAHVADVAARCREVGARLFVNVTQSLGVLRFDARAVGADYVAAHGYKWLLGPRGAAWLYVRPELLAQVQPLAPNWKSVPEPYADYYGPIELAADARRLDASLPWFSWVGMRAALDLLMSLDAAEVERRSLQLAAAFREEATQRGFRTVPVDAPTQIVGLDVGDAPAMKRRLQEHRVIAAVRGGFVRLGFHGFNDEEDVERALEALGRP